jgi:hypothetical protein
MQPQAAAAAGEKGGELKYHSLSRRELQALCKEYHIPANKSNVAMAQALAALHNTTVSSIASILHSQTICSLLPLYTEVSKSWLQSSTRICLLV